MPLHTRTGLTRTVGSALMLSFVAAQGCGGAVGLGENGSANAAGSAGKDRGGAGFGGGRAGAGGSGRGDSGASDSAGRGGASGSEADAGVAGAGDVDAGTIGDDAGMVHVDAGTIGDDAGMGDVDSGMGDVDAGAGGAPPNPAACVHGGHSVLLPSGDWVCDCPAGIWGDKCQTTTVEIAASVRSGFRSGCALGSDGNIRCWGYSSNASPELLNGPYTHLGGGCAIKADQTLDCPRMIGPYAPPPSGTFTQLSGSDLRSCAIRTDGTAVCWPPYANSPPADTFVQVAAGATAACGIHPDGSLACWGDTIDALVPPPGTFSTVAVDYGVACALDGDGKMFCWGDSALSALPGLFQQVAVSRNLCGLRLSGALECASPWSYASYVPPAPNEAFSSVSLSTVTACGIHPDGSATCWGGDRPPTGRFSTVAKGSGSPCGIRTDGSIDCWSSSWPLESQGALLPAGKFTQVTQDCALRDDRTVACWFGLAPSGTFTYLVERQDRNGMCGVRTDGTIDCWWIGTPMDHPAGQYTRLFAGYNTVCGIDIAGHLHCWGWSLTEPPPAGSFTDGAFAWADYNDGGNSDQAACALNTDGKLVCWGSYVRNGLGAIPSDRYTALSSHRGGMCGVKSDGSLGCWGTGAGPSGALPQGEFVSISGNCAVRKDAQLVCWGDAVRPAQD